MELRKEYFTVTVKSNFLFIENTVCSSLLSFQFVNIEKQLFFFKYHGHRLLGFSCLLEYLNLNATCYPTIISNVIIHFTRNEYMRV